MAAAVLPTSTSAVGYLFFSAFFSALFASLLDFLASLGPLKPLFVCLEKF
jgi:hypothetical protein